LGFGVFLQIRHSHDVQLVPLVVAFGDKVF
jgi:hypothetical protein